MTSPAFVAFVGFAGEGTLPLERERLKKGAAILWCRASGDWLSPGAEPVF